MENTDKNMKLYDTLVNLEKKLLEGNFDVNLELQSHKSDIDRLREVVNELKNQELHLSSSHKEDFDLLGKDLSVAANNLADLITKIESLEGRLVVLEEHKSTADKRVWSYVDKAIIAIISGIITLLFNSLV